MVMRCGSIATVCLDLERFELALGVFPAIHKGTACHSHPHAFLEQSGVMLDVFVPPLDVGPETTTVFIVTAFLRDRSSRHHRTCTFWALESCHLQPGRRDLFRLS